MLSSTSVFSLAATGLEWLVGLHLFRLCTRASSRQSQGSGPADSAYRRPGSQSIRIAHRVLAPSLLRLPSLTLCRRRCYRQLWLYPQLHDQSILSMYSQSHPSKRTMLPSSDPQRLRPQFLSTQMSPSIRTTSFASSNSHQAFVSFLSLCFSQSHPLSFCHHRIDHLIANDSPRYVRVPVEVLGVCMQ